MEAQRAITEREREREREEAHAKRAHATHKHTIHTIYQIKFQSTFARKRLLKFPWPILSLLS